MRFNFCATLQQKSPLFFFCQFYAKLLVYFFAGDRQQTGFCFLLSIECRFFMRSFEIAFSECETIKGNSSTWNFSFFHLVVFTCLPAAFDVMQVGVLTSGSLSFLSSILLHLHRSRDISDLLAQRELISSRMKSASDCSKLETMLMRRSLKKELVGIWKESELNRLRTDNTICFLDEDIFDSSWSHLWSNRNRFKWWKLKRC